MASRRSLSAALQAISRTGLRLQQQTPALPSRAAQIPARRLVPLSSRGSGLPRPAKAVGARAYSQASQAKVWSFEDVQKVTNEAQPGVIIVDAREPGELQQTGRIPGAINIPITSAPDSFHIKDEDFEDRFGYPRPAKDAEVVFYCKAGVRSRAAAGLARDAGWTKVGEYPGSWVDWFEKGGKVERK
ncbi:Rhodanese-like protein [Thozetella sp. PMI_491]|nr:Rhodanese-like protein [Thozetella sp. PMI_491]